MNGNITRPAALVLLLALVFVASAHAVDDDPLGVYGPRLDQWQSQMITYGHKQCQFLNDTTQSSDSLLAATYYDAQRVYSQIAKYTNDPTWYACADQAASIYRDQYVVPNNGQVPGYWNFTLGMASDFLRTANSRSRNGVYLLSQNAAYAPDSTPLDWTVSYEKSREVAYAIHSYLDAEAVGYPPRARLADLVTQALGHIDQWFVSKTAADLQPFMVGLTMEALIRVFEKTQDSRIPDAIRVAVDGLWATAWLPSSQAFYYQRSSPTAAPDLNLLIAPAFAWIYARTADVTYRDRGDQVFAGGVTGAWLDGAKQFDQNYRWSFAYVSWRALGRGVPQPTPTPAKTSTPATAPTRTPMPAPTPTPVSDSSVPTTSITTPYSGETITGTQAVDVVSSDDTGSIIGDILVDNAPVASFSGTSASYKWNTTSAGDGAHTLQSKVEDRVGNVAVSAPVRVTVNNTDLIPPSVDITYPASGTSVRRGKVLGISVSASDNLGMSRVEIYVNAKQLCSDSVAPYGCNWKVPASSAVKSYQIEAKALDSYGNAATSDVTVFPSR